MSDRNYTGQEAFGAASPGAPAGGVSTFRPPAHVTPLRGPGSLLPLRAPYALSVGGAQGQLNNALPFAPAAASPADPLRGASGPAPANLAAANVAPSNPSPMPFASAPAQAYSAGYSGAAPPAGYGGPPAGGAYPPPPAMLVPMGPAPVAPTPQPLQPPAMVAQQTPAMVPQVQPAPPAAKPAGSTTDPIGTDINAQLAEKPKPAEPLTDANGDFATEVMTAVKSPAAPPHPAEAAPTRTADMPSPVAELAKPADPPRSDGAAEPAAPHGPGPSPWAANTRVQAEALPSAHVVRPREPEDEAPRRRVAPPPPSRTGRSGRGFIVLLVFVLLAAGAVLAFLITKKRVLSSDPISIGVNEDGTPITPTAEPVETASAAPTASQSAPKPKPVAPGKPKSNDDVYKPPVAPPPGAGKYNPTDL